MTARSVGSPTEVKTAAIRAVSSGDLHELPDGRTGVYFGNQDAAIGDDIVLHTLERLEVDAGAFAATSAGDPANFDFSTQALVVSGGTDVGRYVFDKALNATSAQILLNDPGNVDEYTPAA